MADSSKIYFHGGAGIVTGSNFLLDADTIKILIDCGLTQGRHTAEDVNWQKFPYDPASIPALVVTHAHIDHIGRIPKLVREGFRGRIISTEATKALAEPLLLDSMELLAHDARKHGKELLYTTEDVAHAMTLWEGVTYHMPQDMGGGVTLELLNSGHILGSAMAKFTREGKEIIFTGDLGGGNSPLLSPTDPIAGVQYLVMESVYGDRVRGNDANRREMLEDTIEDTAARDGTLLIPAFSTERTQDLLFEIRDLMIEKRVPSMPVYVDSPLASKITEAYLKYPQYFAEPVRSRIEAGEHIFSFPELRFVEDPQESSKVAALPGPKIVLAGSGMSNGGRVHTYHQRVLPDEKSTVLIVGYQAAGSLGRRLIEGDREVRVMGQEVQVHCHIEANYGYSAHMDGEQLLEFVNKAAPSIKEVFVVMGEPASSAFLVQRIRDYLSLKAVAPQAGESIAIDF
ncbi:MAG TPA: MBL fold metallo-hydrolase [Candidatus Paceibacterota bacterium]|nr:MBL fold metallo-hydrolase [Candidatus Paceibacterota bacterium]